MIVTTHALYIAGHHLTVRSAADADYVQVLARLVDDRILSAGGQGAGPIGSVLLAALALADELKKSEDEVARLRRDVQWRADKMLTTLDELKRSRRSGLGAD